MPPGLISINSFGWGGVNGHIVCEPCHIKKSNSYKRPKHRLVVFSGRTPEAINYALKHVQNNQDDDEFLALLDEIHKTNIVGHSYRG